MELFWYERQTNKAPGPNQGRIRQTRQIRARKGRTHPQRNRARKNKTEKKKKKKRTYQLLLLLLLFGVLLVGVGVLPGRLDIETAFKWGKHQLLGTP